MSESDYIKKIDAIKAIAEQAMFEATVNNPPPKMLTHF